MTVHHRSDRVVLHTGDAVQVLRELPTGSADCVVTSPPYWGLRDYEVPGQYGHESTVEDYVETMCRVFGEVVRVLTPDGTCWLNLGDSYGGSWGNYVAPGSTAPTSRDTTRRHHGCLRPPQSRHRPKDLMGVPWRVAMALQDDGWLLRNAIIWHKPNGMPASVRDRLTCRYETVFLLARSPHHVFNGGALDPDHLGDVWSISTRPYRSGHVAVGPIEIPLRAIQAGCGPGGVVLDPFSGTATTGLAACQLGRSYIGIDLNPRFHDLAIVELTQPGRRR